MPGKELAKKRMPKIMMLLIPCFIATIGIAYAEAENASPQLNTWWIYLTIFVLAAVLGGSIVFLFILQRKYLDACIKDNQLAIFSKSAAGVPEGTIRAMISFIIITISLYLSVLLFFQVVGSNSKFPEALSSLLGAVVGFYFGSKSGGKGDGEVLQEEVKNLKTGQDKTESDSLLAKIKKGIDMSQAIMGILPNEQKKKYENVITKMEQGYDTIKTLTAGGGIKDAVAKGQELFDLFRKENPARDVFSKAMASFGKVLGGTGPAVALIMTVVGVGVKLVGSAYEKWMKRILNVPLTPAVLPLKEIDANTGFTLLVSSPVFKAAFAAELDGNDRPFLTRAAELIARNNVDDFYTAYKDRFDSRDQFDQGLQEFRRAALDAELAADTTGKADLFADAGGLQNCVKAIDAINKDEEASANLHRLAMVVEELQRQGEPVPTIFEKVLKEENIL